MGTREEVTLSDVVEELGLRDGTVSSRRIAKTRLLEFIKTDNMDILGAINVFLSKAGRAAITPAFSANEHHAFLKEYYECCLRQDPKSEWACTRYQAGWDIVNWFMLAWRAKEVRRTDAIKDWLKELYLNADSGLRTCLETATLEHLFEDRKVRKYFADWRAEATLSQAYVRAVDWSEAGGSSPLGKKEWLKRIAEGYRKP